MIKKIILIFILINCLAILPTFATDEIVSSQMEALNISSLIKEGQAYTKNAFPDIDVNELLNSAIKGKIDNKGIFKNVLSILGNEITATFSLIGSMLLIIIIHSILKGFSDNLDNKGVSNITYYVEYILIVTLIMTNFASIINMIKEAINNLVGFISSLIPILLALMSVSRKYCLYYCYTTYYFICKNFYSKWDNTLYFTNDIYWNSYNNSI